MRSDPKALAKKLHPLASRLLEGAVADAVSLGHPEIRAEHLAMRLLRSEGDAPELASALGLELGSIERSVARLLDSARGGHSGRPSLSPSIFEWIEDAWLLASLELEETSVRSGALLLQLFRKSGRYLDEVPRELREATAHGVGEAAIAKFHAWTGGSPEASRGGGDSRPSSSAPSGTSAGAVGAVGAGAGAACLERFTTNLTALAREGRIDPVFGRHREIRQVIDILCRRRKNNPVVVGEPGVGKTALVEGLALAIANGEVPEAMREFEVLSLDLGALQAGASVRGEFENRLKGVVQAVVASPRPIVLFIDEAHTLIGAGGNAGGSDAANLLKPALARGELRTIAATTWAEYKKYFEKDAALERRFQPVKVDEPDEESAIVMLRGVREAFEKAHGVPIRDEAVVAAVKLSRRFVAGRQLPDKAVDVLDMTAARVRVSRHARPEPLVALDEEVLAIGRALTAIDRDAADDEAGNHASRPECSEGALRARFEDAKDERSAMERELVAARATAEAYLAARARGERVVRPALDPRFIRLDVDAEAVAESISRWTSVPVGRMQTDLARVALDLETRLRDRVFGQDSAMGVIAEAVRASVAGIRDPGAPTAVLLLVGPSGVGKTETAHALADVLYGGERFLTSIHMTEFQEKHTVSRLIGSPPGYVGYGEGGELTEAVRQRPYGVVLLDECEKSHPDVMNVFYQVFDKGVLTDGEGRSIDFRNSLVILTSNLASDLVARELAERSDDSDAGAAPVDGDTNGGIDQARLIAAIRPVLSAHFKPALLARMTIVPYVPLTSSTLRRVVDAKLAAIARRVRDAHSIEVQFAEGVRELLVRRCTESEAGARNAEHVLRGSLMPRIARVLLERLTASESGADSVHASACAPATMLVDLSPSGELRVELDSLEP